MEGEETTPLLRDEGTSSQSSSPHAARRSSTVFIDPDVAAAASFSADFESQSSAPRFFHQSTNLYQRSFSSHESLHSRRSESRSIPLSSPQRISFSKSGQFHPSPSSEPSSPLVALPNSGVKGNNANSLSSLTSNHSRSQFSPVDKESAQEPLFHEENMVESASLAKGDDKTEADQGSEASNDLDVCSPPSTFDYDNVAEYLSSMSSALASGKDGRSTYDKRKNSRANNDLNSKRRFLFYSEVTGVMRAEYFECLDFSIVEKPILDVLKSGPFWLDVCGASHAEMQTLTKVFGIHPLTTEDIEMEDTREKCEVFPSYYFITIRTFDSNQYSLSYMHPINVYIVVFRECVLSFHAQPIPHPANVLRRIDHLKAYGLRISPDWLNYALIDDVTDGFMPVMRFIELEVDSIDDLVLILKESEQSDMLRRIGHARKKVMMLMRLLITKADVLKAVIKRCGEKLVPGSETMLYLGDIQDHVITMVQNLNHFENTLARAHSNYLAQISIEITQASNRTSIVVMRMTALASILIPLNVITGLWGMNVRVPGQDGDSLFWFGAIATCMGVIALISYSLVRRWKLV